MTSVQDFFTSRNNLADGTQQIGKEGRLWYDPITNTIRVYNGDPGGQIVGGGVYVNSSPPVTASSGELWFDTNDGFLYIYLNDAWVDASPTLFSNNFVATINPSALSSTVHIAATKTGNVATIITDATTGNVANTIVVRDSVGAINVAAWTIHTVTTAINYSATLDDYWIGCTAKNLTITLPQTASNGRQYIVVDTVQGGAPGDSIVAAGGTTVVDGSLTQQGQAKNCVFHNGVWYCN
jgi:hypothetical protein